MIENLKNLLAHRTFVSLAITETGSVHTLRIRTATVVAVCMFAVSGWLALALAGDLGRARLTAAITGDTEAKRYIAMIEDIKRQRDAEREQVKLIAQELGALQLRLDRFDALGSKLEEEGTLLSETDTDIKQGKGGPLAESDLGELSFEDVKSQLGLLNEKADYAELALETSLAMSIRDAMGTETKTLPYLWPVMSAASRLSSNFGWRVDPITGKRRAFHGGFDIADRRGTPVIAAGDGVVTFVGWRHGYGNLVEIKHDGDFSTRYAHLYKATVKEGRRVKAGDLVALMGSTGRSTGPHAHFEVRKGGKALNPYPFIKDTRMEVMQMARQGRGKELLAQWKNGGKVASR